MSRKTDEPLDWSRDRKFEDHLNQLKRNDRAKAEAVAEKCAEIRRQPFKGEWKRWAMDGLYGLHHGEMVILYELRPDLAPNGNPEDVDEVYFWRVVHHDDQQTAVTNMDAVGTTTTVRVRMEYDEGQARKAASDLYDSRCLAAVDSEYDAHGVTVYGELADVPNPKMCWTGLCQILRT